MIMNLLNGYEALTIAKRSRGPVVLNLLCIFMFIFAHGIVATLLIDIANLEIDQYYNSLFFFFYKSIDNIETLINPKKIFDMITYSTLYIWKAFFYIIIYYYIIADTIQLKFWKGFIRDDYDYFILGLNYFKVENFEKAIESFKKAISISERERGIVIDRYYYNLGFSLVHIDKIDEARNFLSLVKVPNKKNIYGPSDSYWLYSYYYVKNRYSDCISELNKIVRNNINNPFFHKLLYNIEKKIQSYNAEDKIILLNKINEIKTLIALPEPPKPDEMSSSQPAPLSGGTITLDRTEVQKSLRNVNQLMSQVRIRPHFNRGRPDGLSCNNINRNWVQIVYFRK